MWPVDRKGLYEDSRLEAESGLPQSRTRKTSTRTYFSLALVSALGLSLYYLFARSPHFGPCGSSVELAHGTAEEVCPQTSAIAPVKNGAFLNALEAEFQTDAFKLKAYESLGGAVRVPYVALSSSQGW